MFAKVNLAILFLAIGLATAAVAPVAVAPVSAPVVDLEANQLKILAGCAAPGAVNGQCGKYFRGQNCGGGDLISQFEPNCSGQCFNSGDNILSFQATGDGTRGTNCEAFEGQNCQGQKLGETGNTIFGRRCSNPPRAAHSVRCWFRC